VEFIKYQDNQLFLAQYNYAIKCIEELGFNNCNLGSVPLLDGTHLEIDMNQPLVDATQYLCKVGKLNYLTYTSLDIAFTFSIVSKFMATLQIPHKHNNIQFLVCENNS
jgi:hypothetical protein